MAAKAGEASILELDQHPVTLRTDIGRGWAKLQNVRIKGLISASNACLCGQSLGDWIASFRGGTAPRPIAPALARSSPRGGNDRHDLPQGTLGHRCLEGNLGILHDREPFPILHRPEPGRAVIRCLTRLLVGGTQPQLELLPHSLQRDGEIPWAEDAAPPRSPRSLCRGGLTARHCCHGGNQSAEERDDPIFQLHMLEWRRRADR